mmetsp:Transcript_125078/g.296773  ORF Transcript_125078/g.296773 Transcript_125078/m.296773 type:complete len:138 (+) Transcript_125078:82-495(+)
MSRRRKLQEAWSKARVSGNEQLWLSLFSTVKKPAQSCGLKSTWQICRPLPEQVWVGLHTPGFKQPRREDPEQAALEVECLRLHRHVARPSGIGRKRAGHGDMALAFRRNSFQTHMEHLQMLLSLLLLSVRLFPLPRK